MLKRLGEVLVVALCAVGAVAATAFADGSEGFDGGKGEERTESDSDSRTEVSGDLESGTLMARVVVSGTTGEGASYSAERTVGVAPMCWYERGWSGREYYEFRTSDGYQAALAMMPDQYRSVPYPKFADHAEVDDGFWYVPRCRDSADYDYVRAFLDTRPPVFWTPGQVQPDVVDVDPRVLAELAYDLVELPTGEVEWNPKVAGAGATVVGLDTWVWVTGAVQQVTATATVASGTWAQVQAQVSGIEVTADDADRVECTGLGTPWTPGTDPAQGCAVWFTRSSAHLPVKTGQVHPTATMTITATWEASWTSSIDPGTPQPLPAQQTTITTEIPVAEIQTLVTHG